jgi:uncharacterized protein YcnI
VKYARIPILAALLATLAIVPAASAHVVASPEEVPAGSYALINFLVPHGCGEAGTTKLTVQIPEGINSATPEVVPGWTISKTMQKLDTPIDDGEGGTITERVATVSWTGGPLAHDQYTEFGLSLQVPDTAGQEIDFPAVQKCTEGETRWIEIPTSGQDRFADLEHPAPFVALTAAAGEEEATNVPVAAETPADSDDDSGKTTTAIVLGALGLVAGLGALGLVLVGRRKQG